MSKIHLPKEKEKVKGFLTLTVLGMDPNNMLKEVKERQTRQDMTELQIILENKSLGKVSTMIRIMMNTMVSIMGSLKMNLQIMTTTNIISRLVQVVMQATKMATMTIIK